MEPLRRPALAPQVSGDTRRVGDQVVAVPVILEIVVTAHARQMERRAGRKQAGRPAHPGHGQIGPERGNLAPQGPPGRKIEAPPEVQLQHRHACRLDAPGARLVMADHGALGQAGARQGRHQAFEEGLGAADSRAGHHVDHPQGSLHFGDGRSTGDSVAGLSGVVRRGRRAV